MPAWENIFKTSKKYYQCFQQRLDQPLEVQARYLKNILSVNKATQFGQHYKFADIQSIEDFQKNVPIQNYANIEPYIKQVFNHSEFVDKPPPLTEQTPVLFERTSGSSAVAKLIPYNQLALDDFRHAIFPWLHDLCSEFPEVMKGSAYWSISPAMRKPEMSPSKIPVGTSNDAIYFGEELAKHIEQTLSVPNWVAKIESIEVWRYITLRYLLCDENLRLISIWSPTFLLQLIETLLNRHYVDGIVTDIANGNVQYSELSMFSDETIFKPNPQRASIIAQAIYVEDNGKKSINTELLWPKLQVISCWSSASSQIYAEQLQTFFPNILIQGKGLLATEGAITLPLQNARAPVLCLNSGFYEFVANDGSVHLANELNIDQTYSVLLTNQTGLYRYNIGDLVTVVAWCKATPCLQFEGRAGNNSDLCGEKLTEKFVLPILKKISGFTFLVPFNVLNNLHYRLYVDIADISYADIEKIQLELETYLCENPQYAYARDLEQLSAARVIPCVKPFDVYEKACLERGMLLGDIKPASLSNDMNWHSLFTFAVNDELSNKVIQ